MAALYAAVDMSSLGEMYGMPPRKVKRHATATRSDRAAAAKGAEVNAQLKRAALHAQPHAGRAAARRRHHAADARRQERRLPAMEILLSTAPTRR